jgi:hypothetical protein
MITPRLRCFPRRARTENQRLEKLVKTATNALKLAEAQKLKRQKLDSIGRVAAGVADEITTPTQYVIDNISYLGECIDVVLGLFEGYEG